MINRKTSGIYRGWWVAVTASLGLGLSYATLGVLVFGMLLGPISDEFGWQRAEVSLGLTLYTASFVLLSVPAGRLMDRVGVRKVLLPSIALFGLGMGSMSLLSDSLLHFYGMYLLLGVVSVGTIPSGYTRIILNWFDDKRGIALAIALAGVGAGLSILPPIIGLLLNNFGWRGAYCGIALIILLISFPAVALFLKEAPGKRDRKPHPAAVAIGIPTQPMHGLTVGEALGNSSLWIMLPAFVCLGVGTIGLMTHFYPMLLGRQITPEMAALALSASGVGTFVGRIACGFMLDRMFAPHVAVLCLLCPVVGIGLMFGSDSYVLIVTGVILMGLGGGAEFDLMSYLASRYLGLKSYGQLYGLLFAGFYLGGGGGAWAVGRLFDHYGDYQGALLMLIAMFVLAIILLARLGPYPIWEKFGYLDKEQPTKTPAIKFN